MTAPNISRADKRTELLAASKARERAEKRAARRKARQPSHEHRCDWEEHDDYIKCRKCGRRLEIKKLEDMV